MISLAERIKEAKVMKGDIAIFFLGQAGFILKDCKGHLLAYDIYLSNCCERFFGFKRLMASLLEPRELIFDCIICSHGHYDHLDIDSMEELLSNDRTLLYTPECGIVELKGIGITKGIQIEQGDEITLPGSFGKAKFVFCDHGESAPNAVGTVILSEGKKLYFAGDTAFRPKEIASKYTQDCDFAALPINGAFGNMDEREAALVAHQINTKLAVPCHYWNFAEHGGNPANFVRYAKKLQVSYMLMRQGEHIII